MLLFQTGWIQFLKNLVRKLAQITGDIHVIEINQPVIRSASEG